MILRDVPLYLHEHQYPPEYQGRFGQRARYICNFLARRLKPLKFQADGFNRICVRGGMSADDSCPILSENAAVPSVIFDRERYDSLRPGEHHEFFIGMLREGIEKCARHHNIPLEALHQAIEEFRRGGYKNEWVHQSKLLRGLGIRASLLCKMDSERFVLTLVLERNGTTIFNEPILEEAPDEICFGYQFKDITVKESTLIITSKISKPLLTLDLRPLLANQ
jgi:hypothetical protein